MAKRTPIQPLSPYPAFTQYGGVLELMESVVRKVNEIVTEVNLLAASIEDLQETSRRLDTRTIGLEVIGGPVRLPAASPHTAPSFFAEEPEKPV